MDNNQEVYKDAKAEKDMSILINNEFNSIVGVGEGLSDFLGYDRRKLLTMKATSILLDFNYRRNTIEGDGYTYSRALLSSGDCIYCELSLKPEIYMGVSVVSIHINPCEGLLGSDYGEFKQYNHGHVIYKLEDDQITNSILFFDQKAFEYLGCGSPEILTHYSIQKLLGFDEQEFKSFIKENIEAMPSSEERLVYLPKGDKNYFDVNSQLVQVHGGYLVQITLGKQRVQKAVDQGIMVDKLLQTPDFRQGYIAIVVMKNRQTIIKLEGRASYEKIQKTFVRRIEENLKGLSDIRFDEDLIVVYCTDEQVDMQVCMNNVLNDAAKELSDQGIKSVYDVKVGISEWTDNEYVALHQARFCLNEIYNTEKNDMIYTESNYEMYMDFIIKNYLPYAIENNELSVYLQGIFDIENNELYGFETLLRWNHTKFGNISPGSFIPIAEMSHLVTELDLWVVEETLKEFEKLDLNNKENLKINFNISPRDFVDDTFTDTFLALVDRSEVDFSNVILELTETLNLSPKKSSLEKIKECGVMIALDDFGTGFASLSQIKNYKIDFLKIDISFVRDINKNQDNTLIINAILSMAKSLGIGIIAEGVDSDEQVRFLRERKGQFIQGFKYHKPTDIQRISQGLVDSSVGNSLDIDDGSMASKRAYSEEYSYGKYVYLRINWQGEIVYSNDRLNKLLDYEGEMTGPFGSFVDASMQAYFLEQVHQVCKTKSHKTFTLRLVGKKSDRLVLLTLEYDLNNNLLDLFIEDLSQKSEEFDRLKNYYNRYDVIFDQVKNVIIVTDWNLNIEEWNKEATNVFGYLREEVIGKNLIKLLALPEDEEYLNGIVIDTFEGKQTSSVNKNCTKSGAVIICEWENTQLRDDYGDSVGLVSIVKDITETLKIEEELNSLSTVIRQEPSPIFLTDLAGTIQFANLAFCELTGYSRQELIGNNPRLISSGIQPKTFYKKFWHDILEGNLWEGQFRNKKKNGEIYVTESRIFPIKDDENRVKQFACIQKDVTNDLEREIYVNEINLTLEQQERLSMIGQMAAGIMHEINNPLSFIDINVHALKGMIEEIDEGPDNDYIKEELNDLSEDLSLGISSIKKIAAGLKRFTYKSSSSDIEPVYLNDEINTIITISKNEYKYYADLTFEEGKIDEIQGDSGKIKQVILNLIINASHAIREKNAEGFGMIKIVTYQDDQHVICTIEDNGCGIPVASQNKIFEAFYTTKEKGAGTGLGLSLSKKIIEVDHKGSLEFETVVGTGTTFIVKIPKADE